MDIATKIKNGEAYVETDKVRVHQDDNDLKLLNTGFIIANRGNCSLLFDGLFKLSPGESLNRMVDSPTVYSKTWRLKIVEDQASGDPEPRLEILENFKVPYNVLLNCLNEL
jgi:hypothetical protein